MVALPVAPNCLKIRWVGVNGTSKWVNVFHAQFAAGTPTSTDLNTLSTSIRGLWSTNLAPLMSTGCNLVSTDILDLTTNVGNYGSNTSGVNGSLATGVAAPANVACCVSLKIALHYRGGHPRMYLPGVNTTHLTNPNTLTGTYTTAMQSAMTAVVNGINALTSTSTGALTMCAVSYWSHKVLRAQGVPYPILAVTVHNRPDSMRRRLGKETY